MILFHWLLWFRPVRMVFKLSPLSTEWLADIRRREGR